MQTKIPGSKSILQRVQLLLAYAKQGMVIKNFNPCDDALEMERALETFGFFVEKTEPRIYKFDPEKHAQSKHDYEFEESATAFRLWLGFLASSPNINSTIQLSENLFRRGFMPLVDALRSLGAEISIEERKILITGKMLSGEKISVDGTISSQYASSLIFVGLNMERAPLIELPETQVSRSYIELTLDLFICLGIYSEYTYDTIKLRDSKLELPKVYEIDSDFSTAAFFIALGLLNLEGASFALEINPFLLQPDYVLIDLIHAMYGEIRLEDGMCHIDYIPFLGFEFSIDESPDLMPIISIIALFCTHESLIYGVDRLKHKESNRLLGITRAFDEIGAKYELSEDCLFIEPLEHSPKPAILDTQGDHRLVMAFLLLKSRFPQISPSETDSLSKSCPSCLELFNENFPQTHN
ncbi:MAG: 3-phosphoshikimate 1-carboxyvinyltransferase [Candidatus Cloacimonadaceae bacterium]